jgi:hypothetical protein
MMVAATLQTYLRVQAAAWLSAAEDSRGRERDCAPNADMKSTPHGAGREKGGHAAEKRAVGAAAAGGADEVRAVGGGGQSAAVPQMSIKSG